MGHIRGHRSDAMIQKKLNFRVKTGNPLNPAGIGEGSRLCASTIPIVPPGRTLVNSRLFIAHHGFEEAGIGWRQGIHTVAIFNSAMNTMRLVKIENLFSSAAAPPRWHTMCTSGEALNAAYFLQTRARKGAFGVRQLAAALKHGLMQIIANNWAIHKGASKLAHFQGHHLRQKVCSITRGAPCPRDGWTGTWSRSNGSDRCRMVYRDQAVAAIVCEVTLSAGIVRPAVATEGWRPSDFRRPSPPRSAGVSAYTTRYCGIVNFLPT